MQIYSASAAAPVRCVIAVNCIVPQIIVANVSIKYFNQPQCQPVYSTHGAKKKWSQL